MRITKLLLGVGLLFLFACQSDPPFDETTPTAEAVLTSLPMKVESLTDLSAFKTDGKNWQIAGDIYSDYQTKNSFELTEGKGVLVNNQTETEKANLSSAFEHGDMELDIEFLVPKGSNSGIYFQGRYEIQIFDSYGDEAKDSGCGAIYQRWNDSKPDGQKGYEGHAPKVNASKAPGLWQHFKIFFRAPKFDESGKKIKNALFEHVYHNGMLVHQNVELTGVTRGAISETEVAFAPFMIQGDHGPVAFRNMKYKTYTQEKLSLNNLSYILYDYPVGDVIPNFDSLKVLKEGTIDSLNVEQATTQENHFALVFKGDLEVPVDGEYLFHTMIDDGGNLYIDGELVVHNQGDPGGGDAYGTVNLTKGKHNFEINYYEEVWANQIQVRYEGPGIYKQFLASDIPARWRNQKPRPPLLLESKKEPELLRGFVMHGDNKRTHCISVGDPAGLNYSYDLNEGSLLKFWKGAFGDVTNMWQGRGHSQLCNPLNASIEAVADAPMAKLGNEKSAWPDALPDDFKFEGYDLNENGQPVFKFNNNGAKVTDLIAPSSDNNMLTRTMNIQPNGSKSLFVRIARAPAIKKQANGLYSIDGQYYLQLQEGSGGGGDVPGTPIIREADGEMEMLMAVNGDTELKYSMLW